VTEIKTVEAAWKRQRRAMAGYHANTAKIFFKTIKSIRQRFMVPLIA
jgi:hypothetical protein